MGWAAISSNGDWVTLLALAVTAVALWRIAVGAGKYNDRRPKIVKAAGKWALWTSRALEREGYALDFSLESLKEIDRFFDEHMMEGRAKEGGPLATRRGERLFALGAYVGEVIRQNAGGQWQGDDKDPQRSFNIAVRLDSGTVLRPMQQVLKRFDNGAQDGIAAFGAALIEPVPPYP